MTTLESRQTCRGSERHETDGLLIFYRSNYALCNMGCSYCPFHGTHRPKGNTAAGRELRRERRAIIDEALAKFPAIFEKIREIKRTKSLFFHSSGEFFLSQEYRKHFVTLLRDPSFRSCTFQTNLVYEMESFLSQVDPSKLLIWTTYHEGYYAPSQEEQFFANLSLLREAGVRVSAGVVATKERVNRLPEFKRMFNDLGVHMWINEHKGGPAFGKTEDYTWEERERILEVDPFAYYELNTLETLGVPCSAGKDSIHVLHDGTIYRCGHTRKPGLELGNILDGGLDNLFTDDEPCPVGKCPCYINYMNLLRPMFAKVYGDTVTIRQPQNPEHWPHSLPLDEGSRVPVSNI